MATVNLGNIKFNWKGTYNAGTAYAIDDVVSYNGSSYVCISATTGNLPTVTAKWNVMATAGTNGTDVGTTITTQGDILYRDGSGLQRLAKGTASQVLKMNSSANAPEWGNLSSDFVKVASGNHSGATHLVIDSLDTSTYKTFKVILSKAVSETGTTTPLYMHLRYNNSGTQTSYTTANYTYTIFGKHTYGSNGDAQELSGTNLQGEIRLNWAISKNTHSNQYTNSLIMYLPNMESTDSFKNVYIESFGHYYNNTEYAQYLAGMGNCRLATQAFNGFEIYGTQNWKGYYTVYGLK